MDLKKIKSLNYITLLNDLSAFTVSPILGIYLVKHLNFNVTRVGVISSSSFIANIVGSFLGSYLLKKIGEKKLIPLGFILQILGLFFFIHINKFTLLCILFGLFGLGYSVNNLSIQTVISEYADKDSISHIFAKRGVLSNIGISVGVLLGGALIKGEKYKIAFILACLFILICLVYFLIYFNNVKFNNVRESEGNVIYFKALLKDKEFLKFNIVTLGFCACYSFFSLNIPLYITSKFSVLNVGYVYLINTLVIVLFQVYLIKKATDKYPYVFVMFTGMVILSVSFLIFWFSGAVSNTFILLIGIVIFSVSEILTIPIIPVYISIITPKGCSSTYMSAMMIFRYVGLSLGNILGGTMTDIMKKMGRSDQSIWILYFIISIFISSMFFILVVRKNNIMKKNICEEVCS